MEGGNAPINLGLPANVPQIPSPPMSMLTPQKMKIPGFALALLMFVYSVLLFLPIGTKGGAGATGTAAKSVSETNGRRYSIPNMVFACVYLVMALFIGYQAYLV